jgi:glycosyltransferase involved in cell wall biosynthesis
MRVAAIVDIHGWALDHIANAIKRFNPDPTVTLDILYQDELQRQSKDAVRQMLWEYDVVYPFCEFQAAFLRSMGVSSYITTVHMGPVDGGVPPGVVPAFDRYWAHLGDAVMMAQRVSVISPLLEKLWGPQRRVSSVRVGVDPAIFWPASRLGAASLFPGERLRVGWVGNPEKPYKRFELVQQALAGLDEAVEFVPILWTPTAGPVKFTHPQMADYYRTLDLYVCMSDHEGLPTPGIECSLCGVPIVSVPVGVVSELVIDGANGFVIPQEATALREKVLWAAGHREELEAMKRLMAEHALRLLDWHRVVHSWMDFITGDSHA